MSICDTNNPGNYTIQVVPRKNCVSNGSSTGGACGPCASKPKCGCGPGSGSNKAGRRGGWSSDANSGGAGGGSGGWFGGSTGGGGGGFMTGIGGGGGSGGAFGSSGGTGSGSGSASGGGSGFRIMSSGSTGGSVAGSGSGSETGSISGMEQDMLNSMEQAIQFSVDSDYSRYIASGSSTVTGTGSGRITFEATTTSGSPDTRADAGQYVGFSMNMATGMIDVNAGDGVTQSVTLGAIQGTSYTVFNKGGNSSIEMRSDANGRVYVRIRGTDGSITRSFDFNMYSMIEGYKGANIITKESELYNAVNVGSFVQAGGASYAGGSGWGNLTGAVTHSSNSYDFSASFGTSNPQPRLDMYIENTPSGDVYNGYSNPAIASPASPATGYIVVIFQNDTDVENVIGDNSKYEHLMNLDALTSTTYYNGVISGAPHPISQYGDANLNYGSTTPSSANYGVTNSSMDWFYNIKVNGVGGQTTRALGINANNLLIKTLSASELSPDYVDLSIFVDRTAVSRGTPVITNYSAVSAALPGTITAALRSGLGNYDYTFEIGVPSHIARVYVKRGHYTYDGHPTIAAYTAPPPVPPLYSPPLIFDPSAPNDITLQDFIDYLLYQTPTPIDPNSGPGKKIVSMATAVFPTFKKSLMAAAAGKQYGGTVNHPLVDASVVVH